MIDPAQVVIVSVITILTIILSIVGVQLIFLLKELRITVGKANDILDDTEHVTTKIAKSTDSIPGLVVGLQAIMAVVGMLKKGKE